MFSALGQNSVFYILDKNTRPTLKIGKVTEAKINPQYYGLANQEMDITVNADGEVYEFKKIPTNLSIVSPSSGIIISDNAENMTKEFETIINSSQQIIDSIEYHQGILDTKDEILGKLNPKYAKEKEQEIKLNVLEGKVGNMEKGIEDIKTMLSKVLTNK